MHGVREGCGHVGIKSRAEARCRKLCGQKRISFSTCSFTSVRFTDISGVNLCEYISIIGEAVDGNHKINQPTKPDYNRLYI